jgi:hypothetical protein
MTRVELAAPGETDAETGAVLAASGAQEMGEAAEVESVIEEEVFGLAKIAEIETAPPPAASMVEPAATRSAVAQVVGVILGSPEFQRR